MKPIAIKGEANIYEISALQARILQEWKTDEVLRLDLSQVEDVDSSFVQLLLSCKRSALQHSQQLELIKVPEMVQAMFDTLQVNDYLNSTGVEVEENDTTAQAEGA